MSSISRGERAGARHQFPLAAVPDDPDDDFILELAVAAQARYIVTHNLRNFAGVGQFGVEAITPAQMLLKLE